MPLGVGTGFPSSEGVAFRGEFSACAFSDESGWNEGKGPLTLCANVLWFASFVRSHFEPQLLYHREITAHHWWEDGLGLLLAAGHFEDRRMNVVDDRVYLPFDA